MATQRTATRKRARPITNILQYAFTVWRHDRRIKIDKPRHLTAMRIMTGIARRILTLNVFVMLWEGLIAQNTGAIMTSITKRISGLAFRGVVPI